MKVAIGKPGHTPRLLLQTVNGDEAELQCGPDEVAVPIDEATPLTGRWEMPDWKILPDASGVDLDWSEQ